MALDKDKVIASAQKYEDKSQYEKAIKEYQKIIEIEPSNERVLLNMASCYDLWGKRKEAASYYSKVAGCYRTKGAYQKAVAVFKQAQKCLPDDDEIAMNMAELYLALGLQHEAVGQLEKCLARSEHANDRRAVTKILQTMVRADSENIQTRTRYAQVILADGDVEGAARQYTLALAQLLSKERYVDYIQTSREYLKIVPNDADVLQELGKIYIRMERFNEALALLSPIRTENRSSQIRELFITCYIKLRRVTDAVEELKALARQYEAEGGRSDLIEDAWQRAKQLAPHDPEVSEYFGEEPPLLSDSALNIVSPGVAAERMNGDDGISPTDRMLAQKFSQAMDAYRQGRANEAKAFCLQIIDTNEQHLPALQLLSQICEHQGDLVTLAQIERKLAKAMFDTDPEAAVRHVLKAEKCTPGAWENFNLLLVFGLEPSRYGLKAPNSFSATSSSKIQVAPPPKKGPPPLPGKRAQVTQEAPAAGRSFQNMNIVQSNALSDAEKSSDNNEITRIPGLDAGIGTDEEVDDVFDELLKTPEQPVSALDDADKPAWFNASNVRGTQMGVSGSYEAAPQETQQRARMPVRASGMQAVRASGIQPGAARASVSQPGIPLSPRVSTSQTNMPYAQRSASQPGIPLSARASASQPGIPLTARASASQPGIPLTARAASQPGIPLTARASASQPGIPLTARAASQPGIPPVQPSVPPVQSAVPPVQPVAEPKPAGIPDSERQRVLEAIQEIDFYASLMLMDDARTLLQKLLDEFGDVDIIHEAKERLG